MVRGAGEMAYDLKAKLVVVASHSGRTALGPVAASQLRADDRREPERSDAAARCACTGASRRCAAPRPATCSELIRHADAWACRAGYAKKGDRIVIVGGSHLAAGPDAEDMAGGVHDVVIVHEVEGIAG